MSKDLVEITHHQTFESLREEEDGGEFWSARKLSKALEYYEYRNFLPVVEKAKEACKNSGHVVEDHFVQVNEMVEIGSGGHRHCFLEVPDESLQWISKKLKHKTKWTSAMLWAALPMSHDGDSIYQDGEKLHCSQGNYNSIGYRAFCDHVRRQREKINSCRRP